MWRARADRLKARNTIAENNIRFVIYTALIPLLADNGREIEQFMLNIEEEKQGIDNRMQVRKQHDPMFCSLGEELDRYLDQHARRRAENRHEMVDMDEQRRMSNVFSERDEIRYLYEYMKQDEIRDLLNETWDDLDSHVIPNLQNPHFIAIFEGNEQSELLDQLRNRYLESTAKRLRTVNTITEDNIRFVIYTALIPLLADNIDQEHHEITQIMLNFEEEKQGIDDRMKERKQHDPRFRDADEELYRYLDHHARRRGENRQEMVDLDEQFDLDERRRFLERDAIRHEYEWMKQREIRIVLNETWNILGPHVIPNLKNPDFIAIFERKMDLLNQLRNRYQNQE